SPSQDQGVNLRHRLVTLDYGNLSFFVPICRECTCSRADTRLDPLSNCSQPSARIVQSTTNQFRLSITDWVISIPLLIRSFDQHGSSQPKLDLLEAGLDESTTTG